MNTNEPLWTADQMLKHGQECYAEGRKSMLEILNFFWRDVPMNDYAFQKLEDEIESINKHI